MRLVEGAQPHEGLVEMFLLGHWGTLCPSRHDDNRPWSLSNATTICQQLGYPGAGATFSSAVYALNVNSRPAWSLNIADCAGNEVNFTQCSRSLKPGYCSYYGAVGVVCTGKLWFDYYNTSLTASERSYLMKPTVLHFAK